MNPQELKQIAHKALALARPPYLKYQKHGKHQVREGVAFTGQDLPGPGFNFASVLDSASNLDRVVAMAREFFAGHEGGYGILVEAGASHPIEAEMQARAWTIAEDEPAFVLPRIAESPPVPSTLAIRRVASPDGKRAFAVTAGAAFGAPADMLEAMIPGESYRDDSDMVFLVGWEGSTPVATALFHAIGQTAVISGVAVLPEKRHLGYGTAITFAALEIGKDRGCLNAALRAGPLAVGLYQRIGFHYVCNHRTYSVPPSPPTRLGEPPSKDAVTA